MAWLRRRCFSTQDTGFGSRSMMDVRQTYHRPDRSRRYCCSPRPLALNEEETNQFRLVWCHTGSTRFQVEFVQVPRVLWSMDHHFFSFLFFLEMRTQPCAVTANSTSFRKRNANETTTKQTDEKSRKSRHVLFGSPTRNWAKCRRKQLGRDRQRPARERRETLRETREIQTGKFPSEN